MPTVRPPFHPSSAACLLALCAAPSLAQTPPEPAASAPVATLAPVVVEASADASAAGLTKPYAGGQVARGGRLGLLGNRDFMETPFTGTAYTQALIQDQQARSVADVLLNDAAVRNARGFGNFQEVYVIRGFPIYSDDMAYNGLYGLLPRQYVASELLERVEVLRGPSAFLNGAAPGGSGLGGAINLLPKRAPSTPLNEVTVGVESGGQALLAADLARRFGPNNATGVRLNLARRDGEGAVDGEERELSVAALGLDWRGRGLRLSADLGFQDHRLDAPRPSVTPAGGAIAAPPDADRNFAQPWTHSDERQTFGTLRAEFDLGDRATAWAAAGLRRGEEDNVLANPTAQPDGSTSSVRFDNVREDRVRTYEIGVRGEVRTGTVRHALSAVAARFDIDSRNAFDFSDFGGFAGDLYDPVAVAPPPTGAFPGGDLGAPLVTQRTGTQSLALADTLHFLDDRLQLTLGLRRQRIDDRSYDYNSGAEASAYRRSRTTPALGLLYKATPQLSVYANHVEGLVRGDVAPLTATGSGGTVTVVNGGEAFAPYQTEQSELGLKYDGGRFGAQAALFRITKPVGQLAFSADGSEARFVVADDQRHQGLELSVFGEPLRGLRLLGGFEFIDAELSDTGRDAIGVPKRQFNLGAEWLVPGVPGLALSARAIHTGSQAADEANTLELASWTRLDLGARYSFELGGQDLTLRTRIDNVTDRAYWASTGGFPGANYLVLGAPRTLVVSLTAAF